MNNKTVDHLMIKAKSYTKMRNLVEAQRLYHSILKSFPKNKRAQDGLLALKKLNQNNVKQNLPQKFYDELIDLYNLGEFSRIIDRGRTLAKEYPEEYILWNILGVSLAQTGLIDEAIKYFNKAILLKPNFADAYSNLGSSLEKKGKPEEAINAFQKALKLKPDHANSYFNLGNIFKDQDKLDKAINFYKKAIFYKPNYAEAHHNLSIALLNSGKLKEGFDENEWRWKTPKFLSQQRCFKKPLWDGKQSLAGKKILVWCEQGIGDTIMWSSTLSLLNSLSGQIILECQEKILPLLKRSFPNIKIKPENRDFDLERNDFDYHLPMGDLFKHFISYIPKNINKNAFLVSDIDRVNFWKGKLESLGDGPYIGLSWKSGDMSSSRFQNYANVSELSPIFNVPEITFINLQYKDFIDDLIKVENEFGVKIHNFDDLDHFNNIDDVAALSTCLDMVVSTQGVVPIISAAVGTSTKLASWKQSPWNNVLHKPVGPLVDKFERNTGEPWEKVFNLIAYDIRKTI